MSATLERELLRGAIWLRREGIDDTRIIHEGIVALAYVDEPTRKQIKSWATLLKSGAVTWDNLLAVIAKHERDRERAVAELLEEQASRELEGDEKQPAKPTKGRAVQGR